MWLPLVAEQPREIAVGRGERGLGGEGSGVAGHCVDDEAAFTDGIAEVVPGVGVARGDGEGGAVGGFRFRGPV